MSKLIVIGDIHGRDIWKEIVKNNPDATKFIFMGDYFDSFDVPYEEQKKNFEDIISFKKENLEKVTLLIGNHCFHYLNHMEQYSGYQEKHCREIGNEVKGAIQNGLLQIAYQEGNFLFTHAGVTKTWYRNHYSESMDKLGHKVDTIINTLFMYHPKNFKFTPSNPLDNTGDSITQSPIWVRPRALESDALEGFTQVVGHTHQKNIKFTKSVDMKSGLIFLDTFDHCKEYLSIEDGIASVKSL